MKNVGNLNQSVDGSYWGSMYFFPQLWKSIPNCLVTSHTFMVLLYG